MEATRSPAEEAERKATVGLGEENGLYGGFGREERRQAVEVAPAREVGYGDLGDSAVMMVRESGGAAGSSHSCLIVCSLVRQ